MQTAQIQMKQQPPAGGTNTGKRLEHRPDPLRQAMREAVKWSRERRQRRQRLGIL